MADPKYFVTPFGESGDLTTVPDDSQTDGSVNYTDGFGPDYALDPDTDSSAQDIARGNMNDLFYQITLAIQKLQQWYAPDFITASANGDADYAYPAGARVLYEGTVYKSLTDDNTGTPGVSANWIVVDSDLATAAALSNAITTINAALALKAPLVSPGLTGTPTTPTAASGTNSTQIASTAFVTAAIAAISGGSYSRSSTSLVLNFPSWFLGGPQVRCGRFTAAANATTGVSFTQAFSNACVTAQVSGERSSGDSNEDNAPNVVTSTISKTGFNVWSAVNSAIACSYFAIGY